MKRILIIDDEVAVSYVFQTALKNAGYEVDVAMDGTNGIDMIKKQKYDLVLCDQMMPDISGNEVVKRVKADTGIKDTKIVMLSNFNNDEMIKEALVSGAENYILKYETLPEQLIEKVKGLVGEPA